jgi:Flp pilus assembly protein TadD
MAGIFLSYGRQDAVAAKAIACALEKSGHTVWWDPNIRGGAEFSEAIEEALNAADAVVVLWSAHAIKSPWVRDEASIGRDTGRLVPAALDTTPPPMGFRQFQTINLSNWKQGSRARAYRQLLDAISTLAGEQRLAAAGTPAAQRRQPTFGRNRLKWVVGGLIASALLVTATIAWRFLHHGLGVPVVAVVPADQTATDASLARDLLTKLGSLWTAKVGSLSLTGQQGKTADLVLQISDDSAARGPGANLMLLDGKDKSVLWSKSFQPENGKAADLRQQTAVTAARVLECTLDALRPKGTRLTKNVRQQYLNACALLEEERDHDPTAAIGLLAQITRKVPDFEPAWAKLLIAEVSNYQAMDAVGRKTAETYLRRRIREARMIDPRMPEAYLAEIELVPGGNFIDQVRLANQALKADPENVAALSGRAIVMLAVGRQAAAIEDARRASELDPLSPATRNAYIRTLAYSGRTAAAQQELAKAEKLWPGTSTIDQARYRVNLRSGDPNIALELIEAGTVNAGLPEGRAALEAFLRAKIDPSPQNVERALTLVRASYHRSPGALADLVQVLGEFHRADEALKVLLSWNDLSEVPYFADVLFRPALADLRVDPRFMIVAQRFGLLGYWSRSGDWPDFCFQPDLPYDCKKQAAKLQGH